MRPSWQAPLGWFLAALLVRGLTALALPHPGYIDATYALHVAAGLLAGRGLSEEVVWNHLWTAPTLPRPSNAYWPPGPALFAAAWGPPAAGEPAPWRRAQALPVLGAALLVAGTFVMARRLSRRRPRPHRRALNCGPHGYAGLPAPAARRTWRGVRSGQRGLLPPLGHQRLLTPFALAAGGSLWLAVEAHKRLQNGDARTLENQSPVWCCLFGAGALAGLAQGVRADGLLFLVAPLLAALSHPAGREPGRRRRRAWPRVALVLSGAALTAGPLALRALLTWGSPVPPGTGGALWLTAYDDLFRFGQAPTFGRWLAAGIPAASSSAGRPCSPTSPSPGSSRSTSPCP